MTKVGESASCSSWERWFGAFDDDAELQWELRMGELDPIDEPAPDHGIGGAIARLRDVARHQSKANDRLQLLASACSFAGAFDERAVDLPADERRRLRETHGC